MKDCHQIQSAQIRAKDRPGRKKSVQLMRCSYCTNSFDDNATVKSVFIRITKFGLVYHFLADHEIIGVDCKVFKT
jgi:hypothetical protein